MKNEDGLVIPSETTKLLMYINNPDWLRYYMGYFGIYVSNIKPIVKSGLSTNRPTIVTVNYDNDEWLDAVIQSMDEDVGAKRIFKSIVLPVSKSSNINGFIKATSANLLHLAPRSIIRINCDNKKLRELFLTTLSTINEKDNTRCKFDYDKYDMTLHIKEYTVDGKYYLITYVENLVEG